MTFTNIVLNLASPQQSMIELYQIIIPFAVAFLATCWIYPKVLHIALDKNIVDNPDARKLQRTPIPVLGGASVFFGLMAGICSAMIVAYCASLFPVFGAMIIILAIGIIDDIIDLSPHVRFLIEIVLVLFLVFSTGNYIDNFHGLWAHNMIPMWFGVALTVFACVGIINSINLIDGVDGYSSGFCIMASLLFGVMFFLAGDLNMTMLAVMTIGALLPFFFHNVFGKRSKMFIGDGGTLVLGVVMSTFVVNVLTSNTRCNVFDSNLGLVPFALAVMCVPVFDTIRVMSARIARGKSPFYPDKTHLHHLFIDMKFSHIGTTAAILLLNLCVVAAWWIAYRSGASIEMQLYIVVALSILITFVFYRVMRVQIEHNTRLFHAMRRIGYASHFRRTGLFFWLQKIMDKTVPIDEIEEPKHKTIEKVASKKPRLRTDQSAAKNNRTATQA